MKMTVRTKSGMEYDTDNHSILVTYTNTYNIEVVKDIHQLRDNDLFMNHLYDASDTHYKIVNTSTMSRTNIRGLNIENIYIS